MTELIIDIITIIILIISFNMIFEYAVPKFKKQEIKDEENAKELKIVKLNKGMATGYLITLIFLDIIGIVFIAFPRIVTEFFGFNYLVTIIFLWIILIFDNVMIYFLLTQAAYNNEIIIVKRPIIKAKIYKISDVEDYTKEGNLKIYTKQGNFTLFRAMSGTESLREFLNSKK